MSIKRMDHFTILTVDTAATVAFYRDVMGFDVGPRPNFSFPGAWLYNEDKAILHVVERDAIPDQPGVLDHMAFWGTGLADHLQRLESRDLTYDLRQLPPGGAGAGMWQLFFFDPNNARVEIDFAPEERP
ncbi:MAG TPA: VOC family protein [Stellaceae bacterium]|nr:VOC family protein [Stellaceae bacterium]